MYTACPFSRHARWLQYHDKDTGNLPGTLPVAIGLRVSLTEHIDRSMDKLLLKNTVGRVHSWVWAENDQLPSIVYVKFEGAEWKLDGIDEPGVYPIRPLQRTWHLDGKRQNPVLKIKRLQLPLTPAYAMTAHCSQGKTLPAVLLDLSVDKRVDTTFGAVAASRVRSRYDCLILRPFPRWLFDRGVSEGPEMLLRNLRGEDIDWAAWREGRMPTATCSHCRHILLWDAFEHEQWDRVRANLPAMCIQCKQSYKTARKRKLDEGTMKFVCPVCKVNKIEDAYPRAQLKLEAISPGTGRRCLSCCKALKQLQCSECKTTKDCEAFHPSMVTLPAPAVVCKLCQKEVAGQVDKKLRKNWFTCRGCGLVLPSIAGEDHLQSRRCLNCASRGTRQKDQHTCQKKGCKRTWHEKQTKGQPRKRFCQECRRK